MYSIEEPPLPHLCLIGTRVFSINPLDWIRCDKLNKLREKRNKEAWEEYERKYQEWLKATEEQDD